MEHHVSLAELPRIAQDVLERIPPGGSSAAVVLLQGELGAGKTTFMQALAKALHIEEPVQSPTYVLMKSYPITFGRFTKLVHIDAYRLDEPAEFQTLKPETFLNDTHALVCIEWPERVAGMLPEADVTVRFSALGVGPTERLVEVV